MDDAGRPPRWRDVEALLRRLEDDLVERFRRGSLDPTATGLLLDEIVTLLLYRWDEIIHPEAWLLELVEQRLSRREREVSDTGESPARSEEPQK